MAIKHIRRLPIVRNDKMVGIVTARDLVELSEKRTTKENLQKRRRMKQIHLTA